MSSSTRTTTSGARVRPEVGPEQADHRRRLAGRRPRARTAARRIARSPTRKRSSSSSVMPLEQRREVLAALGRRGRGRPRRRRRCAWTRTTRRSPGSRRRSTRPRSSIRSTIPVALATDTSRASASRLIGQRALGLEDRQDVEVDEAQRAAQPVPERADPLARAARRSSRRAARRSVGGGSGRRRSFNVTLTIYARCNDQRQPSAGRPRRVSCGGAAERRGSGVK